METAHEAGFVLSQVYHFPHQVFQQYHSVGYRDLQKGFHKEVGMVFKDHLISFFLLI